MNESKNHIDQLIAKSLDGPVTEDEQALIDQWLSGSPENQEYFQQISELWKTTEKTGDIGIVPDFDVEDAWEKVNNELNKRPEGTASWQNSRWIMGVAASLTLLIISAILLFQKEETISIASAGPSTLPDNSTIVLNDNSTLTYREGFNETTREVELTGAGYFDVTKNDEKPFIVHFRNISVKVVGTSFYISHDSTNNHSMVKVTSGIVTVSALKTGPFVRLTAGMSTVFDPQTNQFINRTVDNNNFFWHTGKLVFDQQELRNVIHTLNRVYHTNIVLNNGAIANCRLTTTFDGQSLEEVLKIISMTLGLRVDYGPDFIKVSGDGCQ